MERPVQQDMVMYNWKKIMLSLDGSVRQEMLYDVMQVWMTMQQEMLLLSSERFYASLDRSVQQGTLLCSWKQFLC